MRRRDLLVLISLAPSLSAQAQQSRKLYRLAFVSPASPLEALTATGLPYYRALLDELHRLGYVEGQNLRIESVTLASGEWSITQIWSGKSFGLSQT